MQIVVKDGKEYRRLILGAGMSITNAVKYLIDCTAETNELVCADFNNHMLYSDTVSINSAYLEICGCTREEKIRRDKEIREKQRREEEAYQKTIPALTEEWIKNGHDILDEKYWEKWDRCVPIRLDDLYHGMELANALDIIASLNTGASIEDTKKIIESQGHSGLSYSLVRCMVRDLCERGDEFFKATNV